MKSKDDLLKEAVTTACLQMYHEGKITPKDVDWGFGYVGEVYPEIESVEARARKLAGVSRGYIIPWEDFCKECQKAAEIIRNYPLIKALS